MTTDIDSRKDREPFRNTEANIRTNTELEGLLAEVRDLRALDHDRQAIFHQTTAERDALVSENDRLRQKLANLGLPLRAWQQFAESHPWLARQLFRAAQLAWWTITLQVHRRFPQMLRERREAIAAVQTIPAAATQAIPHIPLVTDVLRERFWVLQPFPIYHAPRLQPRLTMVTDSINAGSLYGRGCDLNYISRAFSQSDRPKIEGAN